MGLWLIRIVVQRDLDRRVIVRGAGVLVCSLEELIGAMEGRLVGVGIKRVRCPVGVINMKLHYIHVIHLAWA